MTSAATPTATITAAPDTRGLTKHTNGEWSIVPVQSRAERFKSADVAEFPVVTGREAEWRYTPLGTIRDLLDGALDGGEYDFEASAAPGVSVAWAGRADARIGRAGLPEERGSANAWSSFERALVISVTGEENKTATVTRSSLGSAPRAAHTVVDVEPFARATVVLRNTGSANLTENVEIVLGESADLTLVTVQEWADDAHHLATHFARVGRDAHLKHVVVTLGGAFVRLNPVVHLAEAGADVEVLGAYFADSGQYLEHQVYINHDAPHGRSRVTYKGALQGADAHTVWIGDVLIGHRGLGTDSYEQNRNLVLTDGARADSVPNLEIEIGDILGAGHASATGRFDDEQLFYLQSRGIPEDEARRLVVRGFLIEIVQQIGEPELEEHLQAAIEAELASSAATRAQ